MVEEEEDGKEGVKEKERERGEWRQGRGDRDEGQRGWMCGRKARKGLVVEKRPLNELKFN